MPEEKILATPKVRKFARELGANVAEIQGSERKGRVTEDDVKKHINKKLDSGGGSFKEKIKNEYEHSEFGEIEIKEMPRIKKIASSHLSNSWTTIPHVTHHDEADITEMEDFRISLIDNFTGEKKKLLPLYLLLKH